MLQKLFYLPFLAWFILAKNDKTPPDSLEQLVHKFYGFYSQYPQQKLYVQTDRPYYMAGDDLFGKIYLVNETAGVTADSIRSKKIYVELINDENTVVQKAIVNGLYGSLNFSFHLPDSIATGNYLLRAYTAWMIHYGNNPVFSTYIPVSNKAVSINAAITYKDSSLSTVVVHLRDVFKNAFADQPVSYRLIYKNKVLTKAQIKTDAQGKFLIDVTAIPKQDRDQGALHIKMGQSEKRLSLPVDNAADIQFLPEGGSLVNDIDNNVAFKAINKYGRGIDVQGFVEDNHKAIVCTFKSQHLGMGQFRFSPISGLSYTAVITIGSTEYRYPLEPANAYAYQVSIVKQTPNSLTARVALGDSLYQRNKTTYLIARSRSTIYFTSRGRDMYEVMIPLKKAPEGITQLTLFDEAMHPVSERLVYISKPQASIRITAAKDNYEKRQLVTLQLKTESPDGKPLQGIYALAVTDDHVVKPDANAANIKTHLLLASYLKGYVEEPGYYFRSSDSATQRHLDLVMLTHGWSRFTWQNIVDGTLATHPYTPDSSLMVSGTLLNKNGTPLRQYQVSLFSKTDDAFLGVATTNNQGDFSFPGIDFTDSTSFFIQVKNIKDRAEDAMVTINPQPFPLHDIERPMVPGELPDTIQSGVDYYVRFMYDSLKDTYAFKTLKEVSVKTIKRNVDYDESKRVSQFSFVIPRKTIEQFSNFGITALMYLVPGATFINGHVTFYGPGSFYDSTNAFTDPLIILDGVPFPSGADIDLHDVDFVEVLRGAEAAIYGVRGGNGVIIVNTKQGKDTPVFYTQNGIKTLQVPGYHVERTFYAPRYETEESRSSKIPDERVTLYWNGNINTGANGNATVSFYTADPPTTYTVTLEGITQNGAYVHQTASINRTK